MTQQSPLAGLRYAYFVLFPLHDKSDFATWVTGWEDPSNPIKHKLESFEDLCARAIYSLDNDDISPVAEDEFRAIIWARGYYDALWTTAISLSYPTLEEGEREGWFDQVHSS